MRGWRFDYGGTVMVAVGMALVSAALTYVFTYRIHLSDFGWYC